MNINMNMSVFTEIWALFFLKTGNLIINSVFLSLLPMCGTWKTILTIYQNMNQKDFKNSNFPTL